MRNFLLFSFWYIFLKNMKHLIYKNWVSLTHVEMFLKIEKQARNMSVSVVYFTGRHI